MVTVESVILTSMFVVGFTLYARNVRKQARIAHRQRIHKSKLAVQKADELLERYKSYGINRFGDNV